MSLTILYYIWHYISGMEGCSKFTFGPVQFPKDTDKHVTLFDEMPSSPNTYSYTLETQRFCFLCVL